MAALTAMTLSAIVWRKSKPTGVTSAVSRPITGPLHWAQVKVYGWLLCQQLGLDELELAVVYFNVLTHTENAFVEVLSADALGKFFAEQCQRFLQWAEQEEAHRARRDIYLQALSFPYPDFRRGQRQLAEAVYRCARDGNTLMAQATTGIGKTLGTLFPQLKAMPGQQLDRLFFLTAKTPGRRLALETLHSLRSGDATPLRVLEHVARDKAASIRTRVAMASPVHWPRVSTTACLRPARQRCDKAG